MCVYFTPLFQNLPRKESIVHFVVAHRPSVVASTETHSRIERGRTKCSACFPEDNSKVNSSYAVAVCVCVLSTVCRNSNRRIGGNKFAESNSILESAIQVIIEIYNKSTVFPHGYVICCSAL
jgi:hypothetical protein